MVKLATVTIAFEVCSHPEFSLPKLAEKILKEPADSRQLACTVTAMAPVPPAWLAASADYVVAAAVAGLVAWILITK